MRPPKRTPGRRRALLLALHLLLEVQGRRGAADARPARVPNGRASELVTLGRTLHRRAADVLAYFARPGTSNGPTEAVNGRLEHLRGSALASHDLTNHIARGDLETGGSRPQPHPHLR